MVVRRLRGRICTQPVAFELVPANSRCSICAASTRQSWEGAQQGFLPPAGHRCGASDPDRGAPAACGPSACPPCTNSLGQWLYRCLISCAASFFGDTAWRPSRSGWSTAPDGEEPLGDDLTLGCGPGLSVACRPGDDRVADLLLARALRVRDARRSEVAVAVVLASDAPREVPDSSLAVRSRVTVAIWRARSSTTRAFRTSPGPLLQMNFIVSRRAAQARAYSEKRTTLSRRVRPASRLSPGRPRNGSIARRRRRPQPGRRGRGRAYGVPRRAVGCTPEGVYGEVILEKETA